MFDISWFKPLYLDIIIGVIFLIAVILGLKDGIVKKLFGLACFVAVILLMWFIVPPVAVALEKTGWIQGLINQLPEEFKGVIEGLLGPTLYSFLAGTIVLACFAIVKLIINFILKKLFKNKGVISRVLGGVYGLFSAFIASSLVLICLASPALFGDTGVKSIDGTSFTKYVYTGTQEIQGVLKSMNLPYDLESVGARAMAGKDATKEDIDRYSSTISRLPEITKELTNIANSGEIDMSKYVENGELNQEKASQLVDDTIVLTDMINKMPAAQKEQNLETVEAMLTEVKAQAFDSDGNPKHTVNVTEEQKTSLNRELQELGIDQSLLDDINRCLVAA